MNFKKKCPKCGKLEDIKIVMDLGMCIVCDTLKGDTVRDQESERTMHKEKLN